jgi:hypothetical protein
MSYSKINPNFLDGKAFLLTTIFFLSSFLLTVVPAKADVVTDWNEIADTVVITNAKRAPGAAIIDMAYVHAAVYDAVNAIDGRFEPYAVSLENVPKDASPDAAAATAAYQVLKTLFPAQDSFLATKYAEYLNNIPFGEAKNKGIIIGTRVAVKFMQLRANDGRDAVIPFSQSSNLSAWQPTTPDFSPTPVTSWMAYMRPFMMKNSRQFRAQGPPSLTSKKWARDYNETKAYGALDSSVRTPAQTEIGLFYAEHAASTTRTI